METVKKEFRAIKADFKKLVAMESINWELFSNDSKSQYWIDHEKFTSKLKDFLRTEFTTLPKNDFLMLCDLVSRFRPVQPFSFLVSISIRKKD